MSDVVVVSIVTGVGAVIVAMLQRNHNAVNGRMTELLDVTRELAKAEGIKQGKEDAQ